MALLSVNYRGKRKKVFHPSFTPKSPQLMRTGQVVSPTGSAVAIRPKYNPLRRMDSRGTGTVSYV